MTLPYGSIWADKGIEWYTQVYHNDIEIHNEFMKWINECYPEIDSALEVGCGLGNYKTFFKDYNGIDINQNAIKLCLSDYAGQFIAVDFTKIMLIETWNLVFSICTIENVTDIDKFIIKCIDASKKYVYIATGVTTSMTDVQHKQELQPEGHYINTISEFALKQLCGNYGVKLEIQHLPRKERSTATIFRIEKI